MNKSMKPMLALMFFIPSQVSAGDLNMGDYVFWPETKAFIGTLEKAHVREGKEQVDTAVLRVDKVLLGEIDRERVGVIMRYAGAYKFAPVGTQVLIMTSGKESPFSPYWWFHGFTPLSTDTKPIMERCVSLSKALRDAPNNAERVPVLKELAEVPKPCWGRTVAEHFVNKKCGSVPREQISSCRKELPIPPNQGIERPAAP